MNFKILLSVISISVLLLSCGGNKSNDGEESKSGLAESITGIKNISKATKALSDWEETQEKLVGETPLTNDELKAMLPESLAGMKRTSLSVGDGYMMGVITGQAGYSDEENKKVELSIMDGAGETGAAMVSMFYMTLSMNMEEETETGFSKITTLDGYRATVEENRGDDWVDSEISALVADRYIVSLDASGLDLKELESVFKQLDLKKLK